MDPANPRVDPRVLVIKRGDVFWLTPRGAGSAPNGRRPVVVVQHDRYNRSNLSTVVVAAITSNLALSQMGGNVRLSKGEAGLPKPCVVNITQLATVDKSSLTSRIGTLSSTKRIEVTEALALVLGPDAVAQ